MCWCTVKALSLQLIDGVPSKAQGSPWFDLIPVAKSLPRGSVKNNQLQLFNTPAARSTWSKQVNQKHKRESISKNVHRGNIQNVPKIAVVKLKEDKGRPEAPMSAWVEDRTSTGSGFRAVSLAECLGRASTDTRISKQPGKQQHVLAGM